MILFLLGLVVGAFGATVVILAWAGLTIHDFEAWW